MSHAHAVQAYTVSRNHPYSYDIRLTHNNNLPISSPLTLNTIPLSPVQPPLSLTLDDTPPYTPRSKSLDLLRCSDFPPPTITTTPGTARNSLDTTSTLKGGHNRISSPIFLNSSVGVKPLPEEPSHVISTYCVKEDEEEGSTFNSSSPSQCASVGLSGDTKGRASTMPRCYLLPTEAAAGVGFVPKTPSRRETDHLLLRSKFSMSPVQQSKRSKLRTSQDHHSSHLLPEAGVMSTDNGRSTLGNWSHSLGMAARKLQKSTLARKGSDESYQSTAASTLEVQRVDSEKLGVMNVTPEKGKSSLRSATSLASIRRFM